MISPILIDCTHRPDSPGQPAILRVEAGEFVQILLYTDGGPAPVWVRVTAVNRPPLFAGRDHLNDSQLNQIRYTAVPDPTDPGAAWLPDQPLQFLPHNIAQIA